MKNGKFWSALGFALALFAGAPAAQAHSGHFVEGQLNYFGGDPFQAQSADKTPKRNYVVVADDGHRVPVDLRSVPPGTNPGNMRGARVRVTTDPTVDVAALPASQAVVARSFDVISPSPDGFVQAVGNQKYISLLCKFNGNATEPRTPSFFQGQVANNVYPSFNHFFREVSYDQLTLDGSGATTSWLTLPKSASQYYTEAAANPNVYLVNIFNDCTALHNASVDFSQYFGINMMFNGFFEPIEACCSAWGGYLTATLDGVTKQWPATWMPYLPLCGPGGTSECLFGWNDHGVLAHEMSHAFGSAHSKIPSGGEYSNQWDVVSVPCGTGLVVDPGLGCVGQHEIAYNKTSMGILPAARIQTQAAGSGSHAFTIERLAQPQNVAGTALMVKAMTPIANTYYTIESRQRVGYDQNVPQDGVLIHRVVDVGAPLDPKATIQLPAGATTGNVLARWVVGSSFSSVAGDNVRITVDSYNATTGTAVVTVAPLTAPGEIAFVATTTQVTEGAAAAVNIAVTRTAPFTAAGSVTWTTTNGTATAGTDFGTLGNVAQKTGTLTWAAGTGGVKNITVGLAASNIPILNDAGVSDGNKDFTITLSAPAGATLGAQDTNTVTRLDSDSTISFAAGTANVNEVGPNINLTINRAGSTGVAQAVTFTTTNGTAVAPGDYVTTTGTITFAVGETSKTIAVGPTVVAAPYIRVYNDALIEGPETFNVTLSAPTNGAVLGATPQAIVTIASDENGVSMATATQPGVTESSGVINVVANRSGSAGAVDVNYVFANGTAVNGTHYSGTPGSLHWNDGESGPKNIPVTINDDGVAGPAAARTFTVTLLGATGATLTTPMSTSVSIADNDQTVQFTAPTAMVTEGTANIMLTVSRMGVAAGQTASVTWTAADGTGFAGTDYGINGNTTPPSGTLNWAAGDMASKTITIPILNDALIDGAKTFTVTLSAPVGPNLNIGANPVSTVTVNDNEKSIAFQQATYQVQEGLPPNTVTLTVIRTGAVTTAATATWTTANVTAESGKDFGILNNLAPRTGTITWAINDAANKTIVIPILNDTIGGEGDETFTVTLTPGAGYVLGPIGTATVTIHDDDIPPDSAVQFSQPKYVVMENGLNAVLTVNRVDVGGGFGRSVTVKYATVAGTALAASDYIAPLATAPPLTWAIGDNAPKNILIPIVNNTVAEPPESFKVVLSAPSLGLGLGVPSEATVLILDDDEVFPLDGAIPAGFSTPGGVTKGWHVSNDPGAYEGVFSLKTDEIDDNETAGLEMTGTFVAGNVSFRVKISSEPGFDLLTFYVDGAPQPLTWSGTTVAGWTASPTYVLGAGVHTLRWVYSKDASVSVGMDSAFIDALVTPAFTP